MKEHYLKIINENLGKVNYNTDCINLNFLKIIYIDIDSEKNIH